MGIIEDKVRCSILPKIQRPIKQKDLSQEILRIRISKDDSYKIIRDMRNKGLIEQQKRRVYVRRV